MESYFVGIDAGSSTTKAVIIDSQANIRGCHLVRSGAHFQKAGSQVLSGALEKAQLSGHDISRSFSTGYGRTTISEIDGHRTEIACHGKGAYHYFPRAITVIDIGGQDNKVIQLDDQGRRTNFKMNRKCAAGTGAFIEEIAHRLDIPLEKLNQTALTSKTTLTLNSFCTVFASTEVLAHIREGIPVEDLALAAFRSVARRIVESHPIEGEVVLTGGVIAHNPVVINMLLEVGNTAQLLVPPEPQFVGALGAALFAQEEKNINKPDRDKKKTL